MSTAVKLLGPKKKGRSKITGVLGAKDFYPRKRVPVRAPLQTPKPPVPSPPKIVEVSPLAQTLEDRLRSPEYEVREKAVKELELLIVTQQGHCPTNVVDDLRVKTFQLDSNSIETFIKSRGIYDVNFQNEMGCLIDALISTDANDILPDIRLREWITQIRRIGEVSAEGYAFQLLSNANPLFVIKVVKAGREDSLPHEAVVGMATINNLRSKIPNFVHTYGAFMCSPPILKENGEVESWCPAKSDGVTYLVLENIGNAESLAGIMPEIGPLEFLQIYLQILNALNLAYKAYDFTHYDLNAQNVLIQVLPHPIAVPFYSPDGSLKYLTTRYLARIIDFGFSHILLEGYHLGKFGMESFQIYPEKSRPMNDAYKILLFATLRIFGNMSGNFYNLLNQIYKFFDEPVGLDLRIEMRNKKPSEDFFMPLSKDTRTHDELIRYILENIPTPFITDTVPSDAILSICGDNCVQWDELNRTIFDQSRLPQTLEQYCEAVTAISKLSQSETQRKLLEWLRQFNLETTYALERDKFVQSFNANLERLNAIKIHKIQDPEFKIQNYETNIHALLKFRNEYIMHKIWLASAQCAFQINNKLETIMSDMSSIFQTTQQVEKTLNDLATIISVNLDYMEVHLKKLKPIMVGLRDGVYGDIEVLEKTHGVPLRFFLKLDDLEAIQKVLSQPPDFKDPIPAIENLPKIPELPQTPTRSYRAKPKISIQKAVGSKSAKAKTPPKTRSPKTVPEYCQAFLQKPTQHPVTKNRLTVGKKPYLKFVEECGDPFEKKAWPSKTKSAPKKKSAKTSRNVEMLTQELLTNLTSLKNYSLSTKYGTYLEHPKLKNLPTNKDSMLTLSYFKSGLYTVQVLDPARDLEILTVFNVKKVTAEKFLRKVLEKSLWTDSNDKVYKS